MTITIPQCFKEYRNAQNIDLVDSTTQPLKLTYTPNVVKPSSAIIFVNSADYARYGADRRYSMRDFEKGRTAERLLHALAFKEKRVYVCLSKG